MSLPTGDVIGILADNLRLRKCVLPVSKKNVTRWARGLDLPRGGQVVLYTGMMYQLVPYIQGLVEVERRLGDSWLAKLTSVGRRVNRLVNISAFMARPSAELRAVYNRVPFNVAMLLKKAGVEFGYLYEDDLYSGALLFDLGVDEAVAEHARGVYEVFQRYGVKSVITIDPHSTYMLRSVYPRLLPGYDLEVRSYLEILAEGDLAALSQQAGVQAADKVGTTAATAEGSRFASAVASAVVIHDSCVFARYENVIDEPRRLLAAAGVSVSEPEKAGRMTWCCGGPVESLYPEKALANARKRVEQLVAAGRAAGATAGRAAGATAGRVAGPAAGAAAGPPGSGAADATGSPAGGPAAGPEVVTMCPLCFVNLSAAASEGAVFNDISHYLHRAFVS